MIKKRGLHGVLKMGSGRYFKNILTYENTDIYWSNEIKYFYLKRLLYII